MEIHCLEELRENLRGVFDISPRTALDEVAAASEFFLCDGVILTDFRFTPLHFDHDPKKLNEFDNEFLLLERYLAGQGHGIVGDTVTAVGPQRLHLVDWSRRYRTVTTQVKGQSVMIPHDLVGYDPSRYAAYFSLETRSTEGRLLCVVFDQFCAAMREGRTDEASVCAGLCTELVNRLLRGVDRRNKDERHSQVDAALAHSYIQQHLSDPALGPDTLCKELKISRATLYRIFANEGGVARYIDKLRLQRCFDSLLDAPRRRGEVRRIAEAWGFHEASSFNRKFRRHYNIAPSDCLGAERADVVNHLDIPLLWPITNWLHKV